MISLDNLSRDIDLLQWTKELPSSSAQDPLGLNLRLGARFSAELLHCITSITPRARYFSFFPWAFQDYFDNEQNKPGDRGLILGVVARERALVLGAVLHHDGGVCEGGALAGSDRTQSAVTRHDTSYDVVKFKHLDRSDGVFGQAYKASLVNLELFENPDGHISDEVNPETGELTTRAQSTTVSELSSIGRMLATAYQASIGSTRYVRDGWSRRPSIDADVLRELGAHGGLCEIRLDGALDRAPLTRLFFATDDLDRPSGHQRRRMSLLLMLEFIRQLHTAGRDLDRWEFANLTYFGRRLPDEDEPKPEMIRLPDALLDISQRWRIYHFHAYLGLALQTLLVAVVRGLRERPAGLDRQAILDQLAPQALNSALDEQLGIQLPRRFLDMTPAETMATFGVDVDHALAGQGDELAKLSPDKLMSERGIEDLLINEDQVNGISGIGLAAILIYCVLLRYQTSVAPPFDAWCRRHVQDVYSDISVPGILANLREGEANDWWHRPNRLILDRLVWRFVVLQHQTMSYERGQSTAPLFHVDGTKVLGTAMDYTNPSMPNSRLGSALQILIDLGLAAYDDDGIKALTAEGASFLDRQLARSTAP